MTERLLKRQGDILLERVDREAPVGQYVRVAEDGVIALGEATGHAHKLVGGSLVTDRGTMLAVVPGGGRVVHDEHDTLELEPGVWLVHRQREYVAPGEEAQVYD